MLLLPGKAYKIKYNVEFPEGDNYGKKIKTTIYNNESGTGKRYFSHFGRIHPVHEHSFVFVPETSLTEVIMGPWTDVSSDYGKRAAAIFHDIQVIEMEETADVTNVSLATADWNLNKGATTTDNGTGGLKVDFSAAGDYVNQWITPATPGYYKLDVDYVRTGAREVGLYTQFYDRFKEGTQKSTAFQTNNNVSVRFHGNNAGDAVDIQSLSYTKLKHGTTVLSDHFSMPDVSFLGDGMWESNNGSTKINATQANDGIQIDLGVQPMKSYAVEFTTTAKTTDFIAEILDLTNNTVHHSKVINGTGTTTLTFDNTTSDNVVLKLMASGAGTFSFNNVVVNDQSGDQEPILAEAANSFMGWKTDAPQVSMTSDNGRIHVELADQATAYPIYRGRSSCKRTSLQSFDKVES